MLILRLLIGSQGLRTVKRKSTRHKDIKCYNCRKEGEMLVNRYVTYWHILAIPVFPVSMTSEVECTSCQNSIEYKEMGPELKEQYLPYRPFSFPPIWHFTGLFIVAGLIAWGISIQEDKKVEIQDRLANIEKGRIIEFKTETHRYSVLKIIGVKEDLVFGLHNLYEVEYPEAISSIKLDENYSKDTVVYEMAVLAEWLEEDRILDIYWGSYSDMK